MPKQITFGRPNGRYIPFIVIVATPRLMYSYIDLTAMVLNCHLPTTQHINNIALSWHGSLITLIVFIAVNGLLYLYFM